MSVEGEKRLSGTETEDREAGNLRNAWAMLNEVRRRKILEPRYAHYRRCQQFRENGRQCKAPALKGEDLCYMHHAQAEAARKLQEFRRAFGLPRTWDHRPLVLRAIGAAMQALLDGRIDRKAAGRAMIELQAAMSIAVPENETQRANTEARRNAPSAATRQQTKVLPLAAPEDHSTIESNR